jgi:uncharacterized protein (DUF1501 family)
MKRKEFLKKAIPAAMLPFFINGMKFQAYGATPMLKAIAEAAAKNGRVFVLIQLNGGNDGLNTIIPTDQYTNLSAARSNVLIQESKVLKLNGINGTGFHPAMSGLKTMFDDGKISIVQSVGYPNPNYSHFRATDIWHSASDSNQFVNSGWGGRYLEDIYTGFPAGYPNTNEPDPLAISIGYSVSTALMGPTANTGMAISDPVSFYQLVNGTVDPAPNTPAGHELTYVRLVLQQTQEYNTKVKAAAQTVTNKATYPAQNSLAAQLKIVANLIAGGLRTPIYTVSLGGFDTHSAQVDSSGTDTGSHADLWKKISEAITAFQSDCEQLGIADRVAGMTYSEFGRRIKSNDSKGTDHGAAAPLIVFGKNVNPGIIGSNPTIPSSVTVNDNVPMQYDYRQVYASVLIDWFESPVSTTDSSLLLKHFDTLPIFKQNVGVKSNYRAATIGLMQNYPNPFKELTNIEFMSPGGPVELRLFDNQGRMIMTLVKEEMSEGSHTYVLNGSELPAGNYYYQLITREGQVGRNLVKL